MIEKRQSNRVSFTVPVTVEINNTHFEAKSQDISVGGMFIKAYSIPRVGSKIDLHFTINGSDVKVSAFVRWFTNKGFGVQFDLMGVKETHLINQVIHSTV